MKETWRGYVSGLLLLGSALSLALVGCDNQTKEATSEVEVPAEPAAEAQAADQPAEAKPAEKKPGTVRFIVTAGHELLGSEKAQLDAMKAAMKKASLEINAESPSSQEEKAVAQLAARKPVELEAWASFETVLVLQMVAPEGTEKGKRLSRGRGHLFLLHPPEKQPTFSTIYETDDKGAWLEGGKLGAWVATHLRYRKGEEVKDPEPEKVDHEAQDKKKEAE